MNVGCIESELIGTVDYHTCSDDTTRKFSVVTIHKDCIDINMLSVILDCVKRVLPAAQQINFRFDAQHGGAYEN
jgi:hypothetical protein